MSGGRAVIDVNELRELVKRFEDNKKKKIKAEHDRRIAKAIKAAQNIIKTIPERLRQAAKRGEYSVLVFQHYFSEYDELTARKIMDFCNSTTGLGYEYFTTKNERGYNCKHLYVNFCGK